ncbi:MAG: hypothetical protein JXR03_03910 [Cyclobacteriaceae bacterium]
MKLISLFMLAAIFVLEIKGQESILLSESSIKINGLDDKEVYFGFKEGDQIVFSFKEVKGKELKKVEVSEITSGSKFKDFKVKKIENKVLEVSVSGIYRFRFVNSAIGNRVCKYTIKRIPSSIETLDFDSNVYWRTFYDTTYTSQQEDYLIRREYVPKTIVPVSEHYINSGTHAAIKGGDSRISIPVTLPKNTQEWYYEFAAFRDDEAIQTVRKTFDLVGDLSKLIDKSGVLNIAVDMLTQPPGGDICDVYLFEYDDSRLFEAKEEFSYYPIGSRENIKSGIIKLEVGNDQTLYLGFRNPSRLDGIHIAVEVVAIVLEEEWGIRNVEKMKIKERKEPYLKN